MLLTFALNLKILTPTDTMLKLPSKTLLPVPPVLVLLLSLVLPKDLKASSVPSTHTRRKLDFNTRSLSSLTTALATVMALELVTGLPLLETTEPLPPMLLNTPRKLLNLNTLTPVLPTLLTTMPLPQAERAARNMFALPL